jgi:hypothetical protein
MERAQTSDSAWNATEGVPYRSDVEDPGIMELYLVSFFHSQVAGEPRVTSFHEWTDCETISLASGLLASEF